MRKILRICLIFFASLHPSNRTPQNKNYPQTWWLIPFRKNKKGICYRLITGLCGFFTGHEISQTEKCWNRRSSHYDCNCRWCDVSFKVPVSECEVSPILNSIVEDIKRKDDPNFY